MIFNRQTLIPVNLRPLGALYQQLRSALRLGTQRFDVTLVNDSEIQSLNRLFRGKDAATDVLSFPWQSLPAPAPKEAPPVGLRNFLGDIIISVETARRNAKAEGHSLQTEIQQLILHGLLHLKGQDHERDRGEMDRLELALRRQLNIDGI